jgi:hypothetical protein
VERKKKRYNVFLLFRSPKVQKAERWGVTRSYCTIEATEKIERNLGAQNSNQQLTVTSTDHGDGSDGDDSPSGTRSQQQHRRSRHSH